MKNAYLDFQVLGARMTGGSTLLSQFIVEKLISSMLTLKTLRKNWNLVEVKKKEKEASGDMGENGHIPQHNIFPLHTNKGLVRSNKLYLCVLDKMKLGFKCL